MSQADTAMLGHRPSPDQIVQDAAVQIGASLDVEETLRAIARAAQRDLGADRASCYVHDLDRQVVSGLYTSEADPRRLSYLAQWVGRRLDDMPIWRMLVESDDRLLAIGDVSLCEGVPPLVASRLGAGAFLGVLLQHPSLRAGDERALLGTLFVSYREPRAFTEDECAIAVGLANLAGLALANARLHAETLARLEDARRQAATDPLTGLANRGALDRSLEEAAAASARDGHPLSVLVLDLDGFKLINDGYGHATGDECLRVVARAIEASLRASDLAARMGGEEFVVVLPDTGTKGAWLVAERLRRRIAETPMPEGTSLSASVGVATFPVHADGAGALLRAADQAMYEAKAGGRNRSVVFSPRHASAGAERARHIQAGREAYLGAVLALASALDARDHRTLAHSTTVADYAAAIAAALGLDGDQVEEIRIAGLLHDIGKVGVSDAILLKPGPLTARERKEMERHPTIGARLLMHEGFTPLREWVLHHHERPDGLGYPAGLCRGEIPLGALIIGVADAYEAMTTGRPYRAALSPEAARAELMAGRDSQFDPRCLDAFLSVLDERFGAQAATTALA